MCSEASKHEPEPGVMARCEACGGRVEPSLGRTMFVYVSALVVLVVALGVVAIFFETVSPQDPVPTGTTQPVGEPPA